MSRTLNEQTVSNAHLGELTVANREGWTFGENGEIQRLDEGPLFGEVQFGCFVFDSDDRAVHYVKWRAELGSAYHEDAYTKHCVWQANQRLNP